MAEQKSDIGAIADAANQIFKTYEKAIGAFTADSDTYLSRLSQSIPTYRDFFKARVDKSQQYIYVTGALVLVLVVIVFAFSNQNKT
jgi:hypothetical protein